MDKLFAEKFLIGDTDSQYDGSGINPNPEGSPVTPMDDSSIATGGGAIKTDNVVATDTGGGAAQSDPNYTPEDTDEATEDATSYIPFLALGLVAAFLFIKFGKK